MGMPMGGMGLGPQMSAPGQFGGGFDQNFNQMQIGGGFQPMQPMMTPPAEAQAPAFDASKMEPMKLGAAEFKMGGTEFIPKGKMVATKNEFPDLDGLDDEPKPKSKGKKGKKKGVVKVEKKEEEEEVDDSVQWKGKPSSFFVMEQDAEKNEDKVNNPNNWVMNDAQWNFIFKHYPEYGSAPYELMTFLYGASFQNE